MKKVFSKEKYFKDMGKYEWSLMDAAGIPYDKRWQTICEGKTKKECMNLGWFVDKDWLVEVDDDEKEKKTKMTIQDFKEKQIAVVIKTKPDLDMFLNMCDKAYMKWASGHRALEFKPMMKTQCIITYDGALAFDSDAMFNTDEEWYSKHGYTVVDVSEFFADAEKPRKEYKIVITCTDGKTTKAQMYVKGKTVKGSEAHFNPEDEFSF